MRINAEKVEILLAEQGKTKQALSRECGISPQSISIQQMRMVQGKG